MLQLILSQQLEHLKHFNLTRAKFAELQCQDPYYSLVIKHLTSDYNSASLMMDQSRRTKNWVTYVAKFCKLEDDVLVYRDEYMSDPTHYKHVVPYDISLQRHLLHAYHNSPTSMHRGRDATYEALSQDFYWRHTAKHVHHWVSTCSACL